MKLTFYSSDYIDDRIILEYKKYSITSIVKISEIKSSLLSSLVIDVELVSSEFELRVCPSLFFKCFLYYVP